MYWQGVRIQLFHCALKNMFQQCGWLNTNPVWMLLKKCAQKTQNKKKLRNEKIQRKLLGETNKVIGLIKALMNIIKIPKSQKQMGC